MEHFKQLAPEKPKGERHFPPLALIDIFARDGTILLNPGGQRRRPEPDNVKIADMTNKIKIFPRQDGAT